MPQGCKINKMPQGCKIKLPFGFGFGFGCCLRSRFLEKPIQNYPQSMKS